MRSFATMLTGAAGLAFVVGAASPAAAQPSPYGYGYQQPYGYNTGQGVVGQVINQVLGGGRYGAYGQGNDRIAVDQCARAAEARVSADYRANGNGYNQGNGYDPRYGNQGYNAHMRSAQVVGITDVQRRPNGLRVSGLMDSGRGFNRGAYGYQGTGYQQGYANAYGNQAYAAQSADLRFSCRVDFRGYVSELKISRNMRG